MISRLTRKGEHDQFLYFDDVKRLLNSKLTAYEFAAKVIDEFLLEFPENTKISHFKFWCNEKMQDCTTCIQACKKKNPIHCCNYVRG